VILVTGWAGPYLHAHAALVEDKAAQFAGDGETAEEAIGMLEQNVSGGAAHALPEITEEGIFCAALQLLEGSCRWRQPFEFRLRGEDLLASMLLLIVPGFVPKQQGPWIAGQTEDAERKLDLMKIAGEILP
jgi:hypothetical protein